MLALNLRLKLNADSNALQKYVKTFYSQHFLFCFKCVFNKLTDLPHVLGLLCKIWSYEYGMRLNHWRCDATVNLSKTSAMLNGCKADDRHKKNETHPLAKSRCIYYLCRPRNNCAHLSMLCKTVVSRFTLIILVLRWEYSFRSHHTPSCWKAMQRQSCFDRCKYRQ